MVFMKKFNCLFIFLMMLSMTKTSFAQEGIKDVFNSSETSILYLGVDFTQARLIDESDVNLADIRERFFASINELIVNEPARYELGKALRKKMVDHNLAIVSKRNKAANMDLFLSSNTKDYHRFSATDIDNFVKKYDFDGNKGIGLIFFVEGMSKSLKGESIWVTFVDMKSKKVLMTERVIGKTRGAFGFRNFWAAPIKDVIDLIESKLYKEWTLKYSR